MWNIISQFRCSSDLDFRNKPRGKKKKGRWHWSKDLLVGNGYWYGYRKALNDSLDLWGVHTSYTTQALTTSLNDAGEQTWGERWEQKMDLFGGKTYIRTRKKRGARNKFVWSTRKNAGPSHRKFCSWSVFSYYHIYNFIAWLLGAE